MKTVFLLWHTYREAGREEEPKLIGVYGSRRDAERGKERVGKQPGFSDRLDGFVIDEYEVGKDHWAEGFVTTQPDRA
jgi:hypothetical protein